MTRDCYTLLYNMIVAGVEKHVFTSDSYIHAFLRNKEPMYDANVNTTGGYISGEAKLAITLRLLSIGTTLNLRVLFDIASHHCQIILHEVLLQ